MVPVHELEYFWSQDEFMRFMHTVPVLDHADDGLLAKYAEENTYDGRIRLIRRYYGIRASA